MKPVERGGSLKVMVVGPQGGRTPLFTAAFLRKIREGHIENYWATSKLRYPR